MNKFYIIPDKFFFRLHFVRPRFKRDIENVLLYFANECCKIPDTDCVTYAKKIDNAIKLFPGNLSLKQKTIDNWRTEISALCAFYIEDKKLNITRTSKLSYFLNEHQDLTQFFKFLMLSFQFPGGHIKPKDNIELIVNNIRFKPAQFILNVLLEGNKILESQNIGKEMCINDEEATFCIFNDLRVLRGQRTPREVAEIILVNRKKKQKYFDKYDSRYKSSSGKQRSKGDVVRYAGDVLDYMEYAALLRRRMDGYFSIKPGELGPVSLFVHDTSYFNGYDKFYGQNNLTPNMLASTEAEWFSYVDNLLDPDKFKTDISALIIGNNVGEDNAKASDLINDRIIEIINSDSTTTKDIGNIGEAIIVSHEKMRLKIAGYGDMLHKVVIVDSPSYHPGYDIDSLEGDGTRNHRYIEVKTTISRQKINLYGFHMSTNEWDVANTTREHYCIYRLMLSAQGNTLYILRDPVKLYKSDKIEALPRNGMEVSFDEKHFNPEKILVWQD
ncbi:MAG: DUF3883 domain-containing protein [Muribaculum sp.]|nr:DUF3883 domain-containing protein [Muribaculum sp.]